MIEIILACFAIGFFIGYNIAILVTFGLPCSLSYTYYCLNSKVEGSGVAFTVMMIVVFGLLIYPWMYITTCISTWSQYLTILPFISCAGCMFVGVAPNIQQSKRIEKIHIISALVAAIAAILWICVVCYKIAYILPIWIVVMGIIAHITKTAKVSRDYWCEMAIFGTTFTCIIIELILCKIA